MLSTKPYSPDACDSDCPTLSEPYARRAWSSWVHTKPSRGPNATAAAGEHNTDVYSLLDGSVNHGYWFYAVGA